MKNILIISLIILLPLVIIHNAFSVGEVTQLGGTGWYCMYPTFQYSFTTVQHAYKFVGTCWPDPGVQSVSIGVTVLGVYGPQSKMVSESVKLNDGRERLTAGECGADPWLYGWGCPNLTTQCGPGGECSAVTGPFISGDVLQRLRTEAANAKPPATPPVYCPGGSFYDPPLVTKPQNFAVYDTGGQIVVFILTIPCRMDDYSKNFFRIEFEFFDKNNNTWVSPINPEHLKMGPSPSDQNETRGYKGVTLFKGKWRFKAAAYTPRPTGGDGVFAGSWTDWHHFWIGKPEIEQITSGAQKAEAAQASWEKRLSVEPVSILTPKANQVITGETMFQCQIKAPADPRQTRDWQTEVVFEPLGLGNKIVERLMVMGTGSHKSFKLPPGKWRVHSRMVMPTVGPWSEWVPFEVRVIGVAEPSKLQEQKMTAPATQPAPLVTEQKTAPSPQSVPAPAGQKSVPVKKPVQKAF